ncbi:hypothetical protein C1Y63_10345 [Corynebacterium sp. 13CS0277]|uniref:hypothetical protein n=1 Tax=Corynebacterium sp. 13CS0277 TaxID=2071994 RepID=UPI000D02CAAC|nr:hypothetical protein [Corynebacterium sp. 13CS0277]PRQ10685.1 hypothetical protein C1Y63_10345 [Corynebacterium sp. 13CS0277]
MSEKKLTVAELLARAEREGQQEAKPRRRRSLDEGGVSVAELTGSIPAVKSAPKPSKHEVVTPPPAPRQAPPAAHPQQQVPAQPAAPAQPVKKAPVTPPPSAEETVVISVVDADAQRAVLTTDTPKPGPQAAAPVKKVTPRPTKPKPATPAAAAAPVAAAPAPKPAPTGEFAAVKSPVVEAITVDEVEETPAKVSVLAVLGMVVVGLLIGAGLFKGFEALWLQLNSIIVAVLALAVTCGVVGVVHALRTERDGLSMFLAGIAGLAMTFGPALITGF